jgi:hypothetical protein
MPSTDVAVKCQVTGPPILPLGDEPRHQPVRLRGRPGYRFLEAYVVPPRLAGAADAVNLQDGAKAALKQYFPFAKDPTPLTYPNPDGYTIGTLLPVKVAGKDYLFLYDWHWHDPNGPIFPHGWHPGVTAFGPKTEKLLGTWRVTFDTGWSWNYTFAPDRYVVATDVNDPPQERWLGRWWFVGPVLRVGWLTSAEEWVLPLDAGKWVRGRSLVGQGGLAAERM